MKILASMAIRDNVMSPLSYKLGESNTKRAIDVSC